MQTTTVENVTTWEYSDQDLKFLMLPQHLLDKIKNGKAKVEIYVNVPGGDYSNTQLDVAKDCPLVVKVTETDVSISQS